MDIGRILKDSIDTIKNNIIIIVPQIVVSILIALLSLILIGGSVASIAVMGQGRMGNPAAMMGAAGGIMGMAFILWIISMLLGSIAHGVTVAMAKEAIDTGKTSLNSGVNSAFNKIGQLILGAVLVGIVVTIGMFLLFIPGLIAAFLLMFTFVLIITANLGAIDAMKKSFELVKNNFKDTLVLFILMVVLIFGFSIVSSLFGFVPVLGQLIGMAIMGLCSGYISVVLVRAYDSLVKAS